MASLKRRLEKLEQQAFGPDKGLEAGALQLVQACVSFGIIDPAENDLEAMVREYTRRGWTMEGVLEEIEGTTRGLPCNMSRLMDGGEDD
jgi:hypothetical protein